MLSVPHLQSIDYYMNPSQDIISEEKMLYKLPDESIINIPKEARLLAAELLFEYIHLNQVLQLQAKVIKV